MYNLPQEIEVWYVIPAIRKEFAKVFINKYNMTQEKAASILGVSKSAVSQYLSSKRARLKFNKEIVSEIEKSADRIIKDRNIVVKEIIRIINYMKENGFLCNVCKKYNKGVINVCMMNPQAENW
jgi:predicted transcriptional regulator